MTFIKPFLTNKGFLGNNVITLIEENKVKISERELPKTLNGYYNNIVKKEMEQNQKISLSVTKTRIFRKQLHKLLNPTKTILVYGK